MIVKILEKMVKKNNKKNKTKKPPRKFLYSRLLCKCLKFLYHFKRSRK